MTIRCLSNAVLLEYIYVLYIRYCTGSVHLLCLIAKNGETLFVRFNLAELFLRQNKFIYDQVSDVAVCCPNECAGAEQTRLSDFSPPTGTGV